MTPASEGACLIVNADDYGYFDCVSKGILQAAAHGIVTATGVFATAPHLPEHAAWLRDCDALDAGVHLNLTDGNRPDERHEKSARHAGRDAFRENSPWPWRSLSGAIGIEDVRSRVAGTDRALPRKRVARQVPQLARARAHAAGALSGGERAGRRIRHRAPPFSDIAHSHGVRPAGSFLRSAIMTALETINRRRASIPAAQFLGMETSGKLDLPYLERNIPQLCAGRVYELMCHPGQFDAQEVSDPRLLTLPRLGGRVAYADELRRPGVAATPRGPAHRVPARRSAGRSARSRERTLSSARSRTIETTMDAHPPKLLSVVVPAHNEARGIAHAVDVIAAGPRLLRDGPGGHRRRRRQPRRDLRPRQRSVARGRAHQGAPLHPQFRQGGGTAGGPPRGRAATPWSRSIPTCSTRRR